MLNKSRFALTGSSLFGFLSTAFLTSWASLATVGWPTPRQ
jgi:hypothetical protein